MIKGEIGGNNMCIVDYDDGERPEFVHFETPKARRHHRCCECQGQILPGRKYERMVGKWDGEFASFKTCLPCVEIRNKMVCSYDIGAMWENIMDTIGQNDLDLGCLDGLSVEARDKFLMRYSAYFDDLDDD
jgi:hypothetical protein